MLASIDEQAVMCPYHPKQDLKDLQLLGIFLLFCWLVAMFGPLAGLPCLPMIKRTLEPDDG